MRLLYTLFTLAATGYGLFWVAEKNPQLKERVEQWIDFRTTCALQMCYTKELIEEQHSASLLRERKARIVASELKFFPHLLLKTKYCDTKDRTQESLILWDLTDGEMILDTKTWEKTRGFSDCIQAKIQELEFTVLQTLAGRNQKTDLTALTNKLPLKTPILKALLRSCETKNLIIKNKDQYRLHICDPHFVTTPATKLHSTLTTQNHKGATCAPILFKASEVKRAAGRFFGPDFTIQSARILYLPIALITIQDAQGANWVHHFNTLSGQKLPPAPFYE